jgi:dihydroorotase
VSINAEGKQLAEMYDMSASGAVAFSDGLHAILDPGMLLKALQYVLPLDGTVIQLPYDERFVPHALMNEGIASTRLGLPGTPAMAEALLIHRDIQLAAYSKSKIHFTGVSSMEGMKHVEEAKKRGEKVTCSVSPFHLWYADEDLASYDSNYKLVPPLRTKSDRAYLQNAFINGDIDCIASHHLPQLEDEKDCELAYAKPGMISLQTAYGMYQALGVSVEKLVAMFTSQPRAIFNLPQPKLEEGAQACLTLFCPEQKYTFTEKDNKSSSTNTCMFGMELTGKVIGIINNHQYISTHND